MSFPPFSYGLRRSSPVDPFFVDPSYSDLSFPGFGDDSAFSAVADARVDWKETREARVFKADLPGRHKRGVKVEVDGSAVQISGERNCKREKKTDTRHRVDWKETREARVFKADLPGRNKRGVKVEVDGSAVQISGERNCKREKKTDTRHRVDWKETREARVFKADLPGRHKRSVKVEVDGSAVQISGERNCKREKKIDTRHCVEREKKIDTRHRIEREKTTETWHRVEREKKTETWHHVESEKKTDTRPRVASEKKTNSAEVLRRFRLPANVKADQIKVAMENRMLTVTVPKVGIKQPVKKPSGKSIKISG